MNSSENKHLLWELTKDIYPPPLDRDRVIEMFETTISEINASSEASILEKNKLFLARYIELVSRETPHVRAILAQLAELRLELREIKEIIKK